ncbi:MAG: NADH:ubiquinone reductase (Na(+)-transporting) subunit E [Candidatus Eisenbacteria bacterium]|jgi:Na+-transporting NADH:ubiquinone oxidoreductase subunit E|nr:NADH:ubiquinone reductase (Na(+)-transporting) subunit E [Candidatus Eisenbacteria bacterium]
MAPQIHWLLVLFAAVFTNNILLSYFLGMCSFLAVSRTLSTAFGLGLAVTFVTTFTSILNYGIYYGLLDPATSLIGIDLRFLQFIVFIVVIAGFVQLVEMVIDKYSPALYQALGIFLPLITVNCAILGVSVFMVIRRYTFMQAAGYGLGSGLGWFLAIVLIAGIRQRLRFANTPWPLKGVGITMIMTGLMAMAFMGLAGVASLG